MAALRVLHSLRPGLDVGVPADVQPVRAQAQALLEHGAIAPVSAFARRRLRGALSVRERVHAETAPDIDVVRVHKVSKRRARRGESSERARAEARGDFTERVFIQRAQDGGDVRSARRWSRATVVEGEPWTVEHTSVVGGA